MGIGSFGKSGGRSPRGRSHSGSSCSFTIPMWPMAHAQGAGPVGKTEILKRSDYVMKQAPITDEPIATTATMLTCRISRSASFEAGSVAWPIAHGGRSR
jgi:hypothetical protein